MQVDLGKGDLDWWRLVSVVCYPEQTFGKLDGLTEMILLRYGETEVRATSRFYVLGC